jgi:hypothetical protein
MNDPVDAILALDRTGLLAQWQTVFGRPPPNHTHATFMRLALAWQQQARGKNQATARLPGKSSGQSRRVKTSLRPGTRLVREWRGNTYHVEISESGYIYLGKAYRSLSAIARVITGTAWSGLAFFGVGK